MSSFSNLYGNPKQILLSQGLDQSLSPSSVAAVNDEQDQKHDNSHLGGINSLDDGTKFFSNKNIDSNANMRILLVILDVYCLTFQYFFC